MAPKDNNYLLVKHLLNDPDNPIHLQYQCTQGLLYHHGRLYIPATLPQLKQQLLAEYHDSPTAGHVGVSKTQQALGQQYFWPGMNKMVAEYVTSCGTCQKYKTHQTQPYGLLQPLDVPTHNWESISMDFLTHLPHTPRNNTAIYIVVDRLSKQAHFIPTKDDADAPTTARLFLDQVFRLHGIPKSIVSDRDPKFTSTFWSTLMALLGTQLKMSSARHPETDGQTERTIRTLEQILRHYINLKQTDWDLHVAAAEFAYNSAVHSSTGLSPFLVNYGYQPHIPATLLSSTPTSSLNPTVNATLEPLCVTLAQAAQIKFKPTSSLKPSLSHPQAIEQLQAFPIIAHNNII